MFTGIIKAKGKLVGLRPVGGDVRLSVAASELDWSAFELGESIAVNGVCLTAVSLEDDGFAADVSRETLAVTTLQNLQVGAAVNLEPAVSVGERLGGHLVSGHVDCIGTVRTRDDDARSVRLAIAIPAEYSRYVARKGSICVDGTSLTVNAVDGNMFTVNIIPHTAEVTIIGGYRVGSEVNIEVDLVARYVERLLQGEVGEGITQQFLEQHGYA
jgi:riboflavin synthase